MNKEELIILNFLINSGLIYVSEGRYYIGLHGDTDITEMIEGLLKKVA